MLKLHETYGPIVRISPNQLAIDGSIGWPEVFARHASVPEFEKTPTFYGPRNGIGLLPARHEDHQRQRRLIAYAFSAAALSEQESYLQYYIDLLMKRLRERMQAGEPVDMARWYNYLTFDIISELAFGGPFNCLEKSDYHPLVAMIFSGIRGNSHISFFEQYPLLRPLVNFMATKDDMEKRRQYYAMARAKTEKRIALGANTRRDFMTYILRNNKDGTGMTHEEILANARTLIGAGSHTTASALAGLTFYLIKSPEAYQRLTEEIRSTFSSEDDINMKSTAALPFLHACLEEALRIYPPLAETPPRVSPGAFVDGQYIPKGVSLSHSGSSEPREVANKVNRPPYLSTNGPRITRRATSLTRIFSLRSAGFPPRIPTMISDMHRIIKMPLNRLPQDLAIALGSIWPMLRCEWSWPGCSGTSILSW